MNNGIVSICLMLIADFESAMWSFRVFEAFRCEFSPAKFIKTGNLFESVVSMKTRSMDL